MGLGITPMERYVIYSSQTWNPGIPFLFFSSPESPMADDPLIDAEKLFRQPGPTQAPPTPTRQLVVGGAFEKAAWSAMQRWPSFRITNDPVDCEATEPLESPDRSVC